MAKQFRETLDEQLRDPMFRAEWEFIAPERESIRAMLDGCEAQCSVQKTDLPPQGSE